MSWLLPVEFDPLVFEPLFVPDELPGAPVEIFVLDCMLLSLPVWRCESFRPAPPVCLSTHEQPTRVVAAHAMIRYFFIFPPWFGFQTDKAPGMQLSFRPDSPPAAAVPSHRLEIIGELADETEKQEK